MANEPIDNLNQNAAPWVKGAAFKAYWTYSYTSRAPFYTMITSEYQDFMTRFVQNWLWWYDGWVPYFHDATNGLMSSRIATALCDKAAQKVTGSRIMYKSTGKEKFKDKDALNPSLQFFSEWAKDNNFSEVIKKATRYAAAAGTALVKLNKDVRGLWAEALRFDSFLPTVGVRGDVIAIDCFLKSFTRLGASDGRGQRTQNYYVVEHRYFGDYTKVDGTVLKNAPIAEYVVHRQSGSITAAQEYSLSESGRVAWKELPKCVRSDIGKAFSGIEFECPVLLPFSNSLGCELIKWTDGVSNLPELPFGESLLGNLVSILMSWDYYFSAFNTDMYLGRGRVLAPQGLKNATNGDYNSGLDNFLFTKLESVDPENQKPLPIQFDLRSTSWTEIRTMLIQNISVNAGMNIATIASFLQDNNAARTAREVSTEENETAQFVDGKRELIERPINRIIRQILRYNGFCDDVAVRWSGAGLTNRYSLTEMLVSARQANIVSPYKAVQMFNFDDDDAQVQEEYEQIKANDNANAFDVEDEGGEMGGEIQSFGTDDRDGAEQDPTDNQAGVSDGQDEISASERDTKHRKRGYRRADRPGV